MTKQGDRLKRSVRVRRALEARGRRLLEAARKAGHKARARYLRPIVVRRHKSTGVAEKRLKNHREALKRAATAAAALVREGGSWGGCRTVTNEVIRIVGGRAPVTSRKRWELYGNPDSDHYMGNKTADAVDFGISTAYSLGREIGQRLGGAWSYDYQSFYVVRNGRRYRVQIIAGTHGTGPHLHVGVRLA